MPTARKMAAAPELLAALELLQSTMEMEDVDDGICTIYVPSGTVDAIAAAIAKARAAEIAEPDHDCETVDHDPPDSRNHMAKPYDDALIGHLRNNPPRNE